MEITFWEGRQSKKMVLGATEKNKARMGKKSSGLEVVVFVILTKTGEISVKW